MSSLKTNNVQVGQSGTATNNFTWYQPTSPDGTVRLGAGNAGATTADIVTANSSGNVGIGTSAPGVTLDVRSTAAAAARVSRSGTSGQLTSIVFEDGSATLGTANTTRIASSSGYLAFSTGGTSGDTAGGTERARIASTGNISFGTSDTNVAGLMVYRTGGAAISLNNASTGTAGASGFQLQGGSGGDAYLWNYSNSFIAIGTNNTERARIDSSGNLLVGTTTTSNAHILQTAASGVWTTQVVASSASPFGLNVRYSSAAPNGTGNEFLTCNDNSVNRAVIRSNGGIANFSANNVNLSDRREKTNFAPAGDYLSKICAIPVQTFNYIDQNMEEDPGETLGVVAQDVQAVAPELVMESNWGTEEEPKMRLSIYQTDLQYALMKCIQEQQALIQQLRADIAALKGAA